MSISKQDILSRLRPVALEISSPVRQMQPYVEGGVIPEGSRNDTLFSHGCSLQAKGCSDSEIYDKLSEINREFCNPPLSSEEVERTISNLLKRYPKGSANNLATRKRPNSEHPTKAQKTFSHVEIGKELLTKHFVKKIEGVPCIWDSNRFRTGWKAISQGMISIMEGITKRQREEVESWLELKAPEEKMGNPNYIAFANGVLDIETMQLIPNTPLLNILNVIPHNWNPEAYSDVLEDTLNSWSCGDFDVRTNIEEVIGLSMYRGREITACPILLGEGANGKSTFLKFLRDLLGAENVSSMDLGILGQRFQTAELMSKLANIGDDISSSFVNKNKAAVLKKAVTGEPQQVDKKNKDPFEIQPYCTLIFSCNEFPRIGDNSYGMRRRLVPIPFSADFSVSSGSCNMNLEKELADEEVFEAAIVLGINALRACLKRGHMLTYQTQEDIKESLRTDNDPVYLFCVDELGLGTSDQEGLHMKPVSEVYKRYEGFCEDGGYKPKNISQFSKDVQGIMRLHSRRETVNNKQQRCFVDPRQATQH